MTSLTARPVVSATVQRRRQRYNALSHWFFGAALIGMIVLALLARHSH